MSLAFVFPGQGSQSVGMLKELAEQYSEVEATFKEASEVLAYDLWEIVQNGPAEKLNQTDVTQPAMLSAGVAVWRIWQAKGGAKPVMMAGHSLGEYTALVCAGALDFADAVKLVAERGRLMQAAVPTGEGAMAAILGLEDDAVRQVCEEAAEGEVLSAVNFNSPGQVVVAGQKTAVERALKVAKDKGAKRALLLPVSVPSHCALMKPAAEKLAVILAQVEIREPAIPVINNVDVQTENGADEIRAALVKQLHSPVRWVETIRKMADDGVDRLIECGPGKVLTGLNKRIERGMTAQAVHDPDSLGSALQDQN
ncbi:Malonyl CoA-acyl carrier protein transacylase [hydrothermal vent metagenome]|uniref:[acyl-carrier-protein] S-malonyltransferase n=1 Tax=hydrothermal vent metagenome TaxID=652676 RepID=A0A3B1BD27_9ZZZZ